MPWVRYELLPLRTLNFLDIDELSRLEDPDPFPHSLDEIGLLARRNKRPHLNGCLSE